jgi:hypothetical protein
VFEHRITLRVAEEVEHPAEMDQRSPKATNATAAIRTTMVTAATTAAPSINQAITAPLSRPDAHAPEPHEHRASGYR